MPRHIPEALGKYLFFKYYIYANHVGNMDNFRSHYGVIIFVANAPIIWYSKHYNTVKSSNFRLYFVALIITTDII